MHPPLEEPWCSSRSEAAEATSCSAFWAKRALPVEALKTASRLRAAARSVTRRRCQLELEPAVVVRLDETPGVCSGHD